MKWLVVVKWKEGNVKHYDFFDGEIAKMLHRYNLKGGFESRLIPPVKP